jgi:hypothetical protein
VCDRSFTSLRMSDSLSSNVVRLRETENICMNFVAISATFNPLAGTWLELKKILNSLLESQTSSIKLMPGMKKIILALEHSRRSSLLVICSVRAGAFANILNATGIEYSCLSGCNAN